MMSLWRWILGLVLCVLRWAFFCGVLTMGMRNECGKGDSQSEAKGCWFCLHVLFHFFLFYVLDEHLPASLLRQAVADVAHPKAIGNSLLCFKAEWPQHRRWWFLSLCFWIINARNSPGCKGWCTWRGARCASLCVLRPRAAGVGTCALDWSLGWNEFLQTWSESSSGEWVVSGFASAVKCEFWSWGRNK